MITAQSLKIIAKATQIKRNTNVLTSCLIEDIDDNITYIAEKYGGTVSSYNYGKDSLRELRKKYSIQSKDELIDFDVIEDYYKRLGYTLTYEDIGTIEVRTIKITF